MHSTPKPKQTDDPHDIVVVAADAVAVAPADEELSNLLHDAARRLSQAQARAASDVPAGAAIPQVDTTFRPAAVNDVLAPGRLRSIGRGAIRAFAAVLLATGIGVAGIAWESYGDAAQQMIAQWAPRLPLTSSLPPEKPALSAQPAPPVVQAEAANPAPAQPLPPAQTAAPGVAPSAAAESAQLLQSMARDLATVGQEIGQLKASIEQLKASQQQISRDIAKASEAKASEAKASEAKASEIKASEAKASEVKASEVKASEVKASEVKASEVKASEPSLRPRIAAPLPRPAAAPARRPMPPPPPLAAAAPTSPQAEPPPQAAAQPQAQELSVPRPPMPLTPGIGSFSQQ